MFRELLDQGINIGVWNRGGELISETIDDKKEKLGKEYDTFKKFNEVIGVNKNG